MILFAGSLISAVLLTLSFPKFGFAFLAPVALAPYFCALLIRKEGTWKGVFFSAYLLGLVWHVASIWWLSYVSCAGMLALSAFLALLFAAFILLAVYFAKKGFCPALSFALFILFYELTVSYLFTGFPWLLLGMALHKNPLLIQTADTFGLHFISFLLAFTSASIATVARERSVRTFAVIASVILLWTLSACYGFYRMKELGSEEPVRSLKVSMIQLNLPPELKHDDSKDEETLDDYLKATEKTAPESELVIWPETGVPGIYNDYGNPALKVLQRFRTRVKVPLLCGLTWAEKDQTTGEIRFFNSASLLDNSAMLPRDRYYKKHLVIFGEYVPLERYLPFLKLLTPIPSSYTPGTLSHVIDLKREDGAIFKLGALICFEDVFPEGAREAVREGAEILVNLTNDGWFFDSPGPYQHAALSSFRAVETRRELLRSSNTGVTVLIDRLGREKALLTSEGKSVMVSGELLCRADVYSPRETIYAKYGDLGLFVPAFLVFLVGLLFRNPKSVMVK